MKTKNKRTIETAMMASGMGQAVFCSKVKRMPDVKLAEYLETNEAAKAMYVKMMKECKL